MYGRYGEDAGDPDIWVMNSDGSDQRAHRHAGLRPFPAWSPAGQEIAFMRQYPPAAGLTDNNMEIVVVRPDGTGLRR